MKVSLVLPQELTKCSCTNLTPIFHSFPYLELVTYTYFVKYKLQTIIVVSVKTTVSNNTSNKLGSSLDIGLF